MAEVILARKATWVDFQRKNYEFDIVSPLGDTLQVELKALTPDEVLNLNFTNPRPKARVTDFKKEEGIIYPIYDHQDSAYLKSLEEWATTNRRRLIAAALVSPELPGATLDEKVQALNDIEGWALVGLTQAVNMLLNVGADAVRLRTFRGNGDAHTSDMPAVREVAESILELADTGA